ncbi:MAG: NAD-dependent epimerase/dehydratase family protein [Candidatus Microgenomates bacterium]
MLDYCRTFGLKTVVFRQSCIYGPHQFGNEDQGWVAWFVSAALQNKRITIYGDGKQVRDILYVDDLFAAWDTAVKKITQVKGIAFDIGGGIKNKISLLELIAILEKKLGRKVKIKFAPERLGDQEIFVSDNYLVKKLLGFSPKVDMESGLEILFKNEKKPYC